MKSHEHYMRKCIALGKIASKSGNSPVGSLLVYKDEVIGEGIESTKTTKDITDHSEVLAIRNAISRGYSSHLAESTLYSTHEPCVMCSYAIRYHKIPLIVFAIPVKHIGGATSKFNILSTDEVPHWTSKPEIISGLLQEECKTILKQ